MKENKYDDERFFGQYSQMSRSVQGLRGAGEWHELKKMLPDFNGKRVLDLGCGFGWHCRYAIERGATFALGIDLSGKMLDKAREINPSPSIEYKRIAIEDFDFAPNSFDIVIANMMLYHVPDLKKGLAEVRRVLKARGTFYCATYGENGIVPYLCALLRPWGAKYTPNRNFTLQNGAVILREVFAEVRQLLYEDSLAVTHIEDIVDYIFSLPDIPGLHSIPRETILSVLSSNMENGVLNIPKEYGMFAAR